MQRRLFLGKLSFTQFNVNALIYCFKSFTEYSHKGLFGVNFKVIFTCIYECNVHDIL